MRTPLLAAALSVLLASAADAQQSCLTPTTVAAKAVNTVLTSSYAVELRRIGIVATSVDELQILRDSSDSALCASLNTQVFPDSPARYYYRAGRYLIVTDAMPLVDPKTGAIHIRERSGPPVVIVDAAGNLVEVPGTPFVYTSTRTEPQAAPRP